MKRFGLLASGLWAGLVAAAPLAERQSPNIDPVVLNFALTLEHLENAFYKDALAKFSEADFEKAGYSATYYNNLKYIASDEESHVRVLTAALQAAGATPAAACKYTFPYTDIASFITLSSVIEGVGTSAYLGGAPLITSKDYLTVAGSILVTESLHTSYQRAAIGEVPFPSPYGTPLDPTSVYTIASSFIHDCPAGNPTLPFTPYPALTYDDTQNCRCEEPDCTPSAAIKRDNDWGTWPEDSYSTTPAASQPTPAPGGYHAPGGDDNKDHDDGHKGPDGKDHDDGHKGPDGKDHDNGNDYDHSKPGDDKDHKQPSNDYDNKQPGDDKDNKGPGGYHGPAPTPAPVPSKGDQKPGQDKGDCKDSTATVTVTASGAQQTSWSNWSGPGNGKGPSAPGCAPPSAGATVKFTAAKDVPEGSYVTFVSGLNVVSVQGKTHGADISAAIPDVVAGQTYVFVTSADVEGTLDASKILYGPAIVEVNPAPPTYDPNYIKA